MKILISGKHEALIDDEDYCKIADYGLHVNSKGYAEIRFIENHKVKSILMHRHIMDAKTGETIDHINGVPLDNRKANLRRVTRNQNMQNCKVYKSNTTGCKGVSWHKSIKKYVVRIQVDKKRLLIGYFLALPDAVNARISASKKYHGEYMGCLEDKTVVSLPPF
jgi:hypothetical protein